MIATELHVNANLVLLIAAVVLFLLAAFPRIAKAWMIPVGLACFAGAFLVGRLI